MLARIAAQAYQRFSAFADNVVRAAQSQQQPQVAGNTALQKSDSFNKENTQEARKFQIKQLRDTGTLDNLQKILHESEEKLLRKLFADRPLQSEPVQNVVVKGTRLDGRY